MNSPFPNQEELREQAHLAYDRFYQIFTAALGESLELRQSGFDPNELARRDDKLEHADTIFVSVKPLLYRYLLRTLYIWRKWGWDKLVRLDTEGLESNTFIFFHRLLTKYSASHESGSSFVNYLCLCIKSRRNKILAQSLVRDFAPSGILAKDFFNDDRTSYVRRNTLATIPSYNEEFDDFEPWDKWREIQAYFRSIYYSALELALSEPRRQIIEQENSWSTELRKLFDKAYEIWAGNQPSTKRYYRNEERKIVNLKASPDLYSLRVFFILYMTIVEGKSSTDLANVFGVARSNIQLLVQRGLGLVREHVGYIEVRVR